MHNRNQQREARYELRSEDHRASPYREQYDRQRDISPQRYQYNRALDPRANPHSEVYDPSFNPNSPLPEYHKFPQPQYRDSEKKEYDLYRREHAHGQRHYEDRSHRRGPYYDDDYRREPPHRAPPPYYDNNSQYPYNPPMQPPMHHPDNPPMQHRHRPPMQYQHDDYNYTPRGGYEEVQPAGRANSYSTRITDLLTSIREPVTKDDTLLKTMEERKGYLVMMRFRKQDFAEIVNEIQKQVGTMRANNGFCLGFAEPDRGMIRILTHSHQMMARRQGWSSTPDYDVCLLMFDSYTDAKSWFESSTTKFKQPEFPNSNAYEIVAVPLTSNTYGDLLSLRRGENITLLWSEYPGIKEEYETDFLRNYSDKVRAMTKKHGGNPYISVSRFQAGQPQDLNKFGSPGYAVTEISSASKARVARSWKSEWVNHGTYITVSTFPTKGHVDNYYAEWDNSGLRHILPKYSDPVVVAITLTSIGGT